MSEESPIILVDVRTITEYKAGHISDSINIDFRSEDFIEQIKSLLEEGEVILCSNSGDRSLKVTSKLEHEGIMVSNLPGGILAYKGELEK